MNLKLIIGFLGNGEIMDEEPLTREWFENIIQTDYGARLEGHVDVIMHALEMKKIIKKRMMDLFDQISTLKIQEGMLVNNGTEPISVKIAIQEASNELKELEKYWGDASIENN